MKRIKTILIIAFLILGSFCFIGKNEAQAKNPVILVPGMSASWNWDVMAGEIFGDSWGWFPGVDHYNALIGLLEDKGFDVYVAFYDWRKSIGNNSFDFLKTKIDEVRALTGESKVDIVAHSMGGLVSRGYIQSSLFEDDVEKLVLLGVPNKGSSDAYSPWEGGIIPKNWGKGYKFVIDTYLWYLKQIVPGSQSNYELIHDHIPSMGELMPIYDFVQEYTISGDVATTTYENMEVKNPFLEELNLSSGVSDLKSRVALSNLGGYDKSTVGSVIVSMPDSGTTKWKDGEPNPFPPPRNNTKGDNRVLDDSVDLSRSLAAIPLFGGVPSVDINIGPEKFYEVGNRRAGSFEDTGHTELPYKAIEEVVYWLRRPIAPMVIPDYYIESPTAPSVDLSDIDLPPPVDEPDDILSFFFTENAEVEIIDPDGKIINNTENEIPGAEFDQASDEGPKIVYIPDPKDGEYKINIKGISDDDDFDFAAYYASDNDSELDSFSDELEEGEENTYEIEFDGDGESKIDSDMSFDVDDLIDQVREYYDDDTISQDIDCEDNSLVYESVKADFLNTLTNVNLGRIERGIRSCVKIESWFETNDNIYQGAQSWYDILVEARQVN